MLPIAALLTLGLAASVFANKSVVTGIPTTVYYETLCPYSVKFIVKKLVPTYNEKEYDFANLLANLTLVPYGHVHEIDSAKYQYSCQHGSVECEGNKLHGCAIKNIEDKRILLNYIHCVMKKSDSHSKSYMNKEVKQCGDLVSNNIMKQILKCYSSNEGWDIFNKNGNATYALFGSTSFYVPYISFNNIRNDDLSSTSNRYFKESLCKQNDVRNSVCTDI